MGANPKSRFKLLLIAPTAMDFSGRPIKERTMHLPCLTLPLLAAATPDDVDVRIIYETVEDIPYDEPWDAVGLTGMGSGIVRAWQIGDEFRKRGVPVIIGGIAATGGDPDWSLAHADALVIGEADETWANVISDLKADRLRSIYRPARTPPDDALLTPRYDLMNRRRIGIWRPVQATRGCPYSCSFCSVTAFHCGDYRTRPVADVIRDVRAAKRNGSRYIAFIDDNISADPNYCAKLWEALIPEKIIWMSQGSLHLAERPELLKLARRSGCRMISIGIESLNEESLNSVSKAWNRPGRYAEAINAFRGHGIEVSTEMIIGFDPDDMSVFARTLEFMISNRIAVPRVHILTPVPGTPLYREMREKGRIRSEDFSQYTGSKVVFEPLQLDPSTLQTEYWALYERLFDWRGVLKRLFPPRFSIGMYMTAIVWAVNFRYRRHVRNRISPGIL